MILDATFSDVSVSSRNIREIMTFVEEGYDVEIVSGPRSREMPKEIADLPIHEYPGIPLKRPRIWGVLCRINHQIKFLRKFDPDVIVCHGYTLLLAAYIAYRNSKKDVKLIYHSHEFELGRNASRKRNWVLMKCVKLIEGFLIRRSAMTIVVNDAIADEIQKIYHLKKRPTVVRSMPPYWDVDNSVCEKVRNNLLSQIEEPKETLLMYHGMVMKGRSIERLLQVVQLNKNVCAVILGNANEEYLAKLKLYAEELGVLNRVVFLPAVPIENLWMYVGAADIGMITISATTKSYYYMLPNKFFENVQSETPVICSDFPAVAPIVNKYQIGLICDPEGIDEINSCVERMRTDKAFYAQCKANLKVAKQELCWEKEKQALMNAYKEMITCQ